MSRGDNKDFIKDLKQAAPDKGAVKSLADAVGDPDEWDVQNITNLINAFKKRKFTVEGFVVNGATLIKMCQDEARASHQTSSFNQFNVKDKDTDSRAITAIPQALWEEIGDTMPTIFREKKHYEWFLRHFGRQFMIPERY
jgi:hypothetical protein